MRTAIAAALLLSLAALSACGPGTPAQPSNQTPNAETKPTEAKPTEVEPTEVEPTEVEPTEVEPTPFTPDRDAPPLADAGPLIRPGLPIVTGPIGIDQIRAGIHERYPSLLGCYTAALPSAPELEGVATVEFTINARGHVTTAEGRYDLGFGHDRVLACFARGIARWSFDAPSADGDTEVALTFEVRPG